MKQVNVNLLEDAVSTKYNDMQGLISIDRSDSTDLNDLIKKNGIDSERYFLLGFGVSVSSLLNLDEEDTVCCYALLLDKDVYGHTYDEISTNVKSLDSVDVEKVSFFTSANDVLKCIKRVELMLLSPLSTSIAKMNITDEE